MGRSAVSRSHVTLAQYVLKEKKQGGPEHGGRPAPVSKCRRSRPPPMHGTASRQGVRSPHSPAADGLCVGLTARSRAAALRHLGRAGLRRTARRDHASGEPLLARRRSHARVPCPRLGPLRAYPGAHPVIIASRSVTATRPSLIGMRRQRGGEQRPRAAPTGPAAAPRWSPPPRANRATSANGSA